MFIPSYQIHNILKDFTLQLKKMRQGSPPEAGVPVAGDDATAARWYQPTKLPTIAFDSHRAFIRMFLDGN